MGIVEPGPAEERRHKHLPGPAPLLRLCLTEQHLPSFCSKNPKQTHFFSDLEACVEMVARGSLFQEVSLPPVSPFHSVLASGSRRLLCGLRLA